MTKSLVIIGCSLFLIISIGFGQIDPLLLKRTPKDSSTLLMNMDANYNRPFLNFERAPVSVGGYVEANWQYLGTDGVAEGHQFQVRRMTLFVASTVSKKIKFLSEIEFEEGGKEIAIEFAAMDVEFHPLLNFRGGIVMNPIGGFNQNHDGPKWEFTDRPISATQMLPATWSNAGFGIFGKYHFNKWMIGYESYLTGGFDGSIIDNIENKTFLPASKENAERFEESASGTALFTGKMAVKNNKVGEIGLSYMGGIYNTFENDGVVVDEARRVDVISIDANTTLPKFKTTITGEWAWVFVDIPSTYTQQYGDRQMGGFIDIVQPIVTKSILGWQNAIINLSVRLEYVDWNVGSFEETNGNIGEDVWSIVPSLSFRPTPQTVFRLNYRYLQQRDILVNPPAKTSGLSFGISTYF